MQLPLTALRGDKNEIYIILPNDKIFLDNWLIPEVSKNYLRILINDEISLRVVYKTSRCCLQARLISWPLSTYFATPLSAYVASPLFAYGASKRSSPEGNMGRDLFKPTHWLIIFSLKILCRRQRPGGEKKLPNQSLKFIFNYFRAYT